MGNRSTFLDFPNRSPSFSSKYFRIPAPSGSFLLCRPLFRSASKNELDRNVVLATGLLLRLPGRQYWQRPLRCCFCTLHSRLGGSDEKIPIRANSILANPCGRTSDEHQSLECGTCALPSHSPDWEVIASFDLKTYANARDNDLRAFSLLSAHSHSQSQQCRTLEWRCKQ